LKVVALAYPGETFAAERAAVEAGGGTFQALPLGGLASADDLDVLVNTSGAPVGEALLDRLPRCTAIVGYGVGVDWVDLDLATKRGVLVVNTPEANVDDVAVHALTLLLACHRRLTVHDRHVRAGGFDPHCAGRLLRLVGRRLGLLAFGRIARRFAELAAPLGMRVQAHDPAADHDAMRRMAVEPVGLETLLRTSDFLSVHVPLRTETRQLLSLERLTLLPQGAIVVVTSRGGVYDADALAGLVACGRLAGAGLDVFPEEPLPPGHALTVLDNVILTPHVAGYTEEAHESSRTAVASALAAICAGVPPRSTVNADAVRGWTARR
jgi:D-3-phosphoglycerate dehydrogenase